MAFEQQQVEAEKYKAAQERALEHFCSAVLCLSGLSSCPLGQVRNGMRHRSSRTPFEF